MSLKFCGDNIGFYTSALKICKKKNVAEGTSYIFDAIDPDALHDFTHSFYIYIIDSRPSKYCFSHNSKVLLSLTENPYFSFLFSESSMFVSKNRFVIKTCGTTKLLSCVKPLMQLAKHYCNLTELQVCIDNFSRQ